MLHRELVPRVVQTVALDRPACGDTDLLLQFGDIAACCKRLCSAMSVVATSSHGPCALIKSTTELVYGVPAVEAVDQLRHVQDSLSILRSR